MFQGANVDGVCVEIRNDQVIDGCLCGQLTACVAQVGAQAWWCLRVLIGIYHLDHCNHCNHCSRSSYPSHSDYLILECLFFPWDEFELFVD